MAILIVSGTGLLSLLYTYPRLGTLTKQSIRSAEGKPLYILSSSSSHLQIPGRWLLFPSVVFAGSKGIEF